jgi:hypothetical protein
MVSYAGYLSNGADSNVFVGYDCGYSNVSGKYNTYVGFQAGRQNHGSKNVFIGYKAGYGMIMFPINFLFQIMMPPIH